MGVIDVDALINQSSFLLFWAFVWADFRSFIKKIWKVWKYLCMCVCVRVWVCVSTRARIALVPQYLILFLL